jgi:hypothetical protein
MSKFPPPEKVLIEKIRLDPELQTQDGINEVTVYEYAELMKDGVQFPPVDVYRDGGEYVLTDGFHRVAAAKKNEESKITRAASSTCRAPKANYQ